jgi:hypothetical protein
VPSPSNLWRATTVAPSPVADPATYIPQPDEQRRGDHPLHCAAGVTAGPRQQQRKLRFHIGLRRLATRCGCHLHPPRVQHPAPAVPCPCRYAALLRMLYQLRPFRAPAGMPPLSACSTSSGGRPEPPVSTRALPGTAADEDSRIRGVGRTPRAATREAAREVLATCQWIRRTRFAAKTPRCSGSPSSSRSERQRQRHRARQRRTGRAENGDFLYPSSSVCFIYLFFIFSTVR